MSEDFYVALFHLINTFVLSTSALP